MTFKPLAFVLALALVLAFCAVPFFAGHGGGFLGMLLFSSVLLWIPALLTLAASFVRWEPASFVGPLLLFGLVWWLGYAMYGKEGRDFDFVFSQLTFSAPFHALLLASLIRSLVASIRQYRQDHRDD